ncbi:S24 family peptidase [Thomasclavelia sp.]|uniref:LexA family protein n=1 Tax=Thomasclavelia sp. TaxID=3025757 RepID=UPI0025D28460|nr:S24 family peptidase [Thomasclavelia sp.]
MELKQFIKEYKSLHHLTNQQIAKQFGVTHTTVGRWLNGSVKALQQETVDKMSDVLGYDVGALLNGVAITLKKPILGMAKGGYDLFLDNNYLGQENITLEEYSLGDYFLQITGDSMKDIGIVDGSLVYVKKCDQVKNNEVAIIQIGDEVTVKKYFQDNTGVTLIAYNKKVENKHFSFQEVNDLPVKVIGKVIFVKTYF